MLSTNPAVIKEANEVLEEIFSNNLNSYIDLFFYENGAELNKHQSGILEKAGIIRKDSSRWLANVMVFPFRKKFIVTDFLLSIYRKKGGKFLRGLDDVWVMFPHETLFFIDRLDKIKGDTALDIASGSGAISLFLADKFDRVISSDINPKAVAYARFNAILNNLEHKITNLQSDLFNSLGETKFDYVCWNGPTVAMPEVDKPRKTYPLYSYGGFDGAEFTRKFLNEVFFHVKPQFKIRWWDGAMGDTKISVIEKYIQKNFSHFPLMVTIDFLNERVRVPLKMYDKMYVKYCLNKFDLSQAQKQDETAVKNWYKKLKKLGLNYVYISIISIESSNKFEINHTFSKKNLVMPRHVYGFEWHYCSRQYIRSYLLKNN